MTDFSTTNLPLTEQVQELIAELDARKKERDTTCAQLAVAAFIQSVLSAD